jgi:hypothetical protein
MSLKNIFSILILIFMASVGFAQTLSDVSYLYKLSQSIRGVPPSQEELQNLNAAKTSGTLPTFFNERIRFYLSTPQHTEKMTLRMEDMLYLKRNTIRGGLYDVQDPRTLSLTDSAYSITSNFLRDIAKNNKSWNTLLTGKRYTNIKAEQSDKKFYDDLLDIKSSEVRLGSPYLDDGIAYPLQFEEINFADDDDRVAGVITTPRFFARYTTTALNKNRRRAAAIFRTFLCDAMTAAIPANHDISKIADLMFPSNGQGMSESQIRNMLDARHGTQSDCMSCHYKLDPMGQTLRLSPMTPSVYPSAGALIYKRADGSLVNEQVTGIGQLAQKITEQPEFVNCQVKNFWNWFIGNDYRISDDELKSLSAKFNELGRRPNDFIAYLVNRPEFRSRKLPNETTAMVKDVKDLFVRCNTCHVGKYSDLRGPLPDFSQWPIGQGTSFSAKEWITAIWNRLDLENDGEHRSMPPTEGFRPSRQELLNLKKWIESGAPDETGKKMLDGGK